MARGECPWPLNVAVDSIILWNMIGCASSTWGEIWRTICGDEEAGRASDSRASATSPSADQVALFRESYATKLPLFEVMPVLTFGAKLNAGKSGSNETSRARIL